MSRKRAAPSKPPDKESVKNVLDYLDELDLPDGAYWAMADDLLGLEPGGVVDVIAEDPGYFSGPEDDWI